jgi:hypothetical protein
VEFMKFFLKGLDSSKIQTRFNLEFVLEFIIQNTERFEIQNTKRKDAEFEFIYQLVKFGIFWR